ncbi:MULTISPECIES: DUF805 domain-containing protein [unclassified Psychrobacter]|uniref:DUF805 domain-containing protein n=1 Tax=unclassified Psychrobacter TaxID=196806 RepID=UPI00191A2499|nr:MULTISPECIES: DUF805 domain-containing protein [unclassified Psychrobacter]MDA5133339.1 DUF805 domain-containing protein [Psychrobacter sp. ANT_H3]
MLDKTTPPPLPNSAMVNNHSAEANFGILDWFKKALRNYTNFSGRARRKEYWYFVLVQMGLIIVAMILDAIIFNSETGLFYIVVALGLFLPGLAVTIRRLHDTSRSGWWFLLSILPLIGSIILLVFLASDTKLETNQWGPPAK